MRMMIWLALALATTPVPQSDPEKRVVDYLKANMAPGERVVVSRLYNEVFTRPEERAVLDRLFNSFFKIPLFAAQHQQVEGRPPTLDELSQQFGFDVPGEAQVILKIIQSDPRMPAFFECDPSTGEIIRVDVEAVAAHPRFGKPLERTLAGWVGRPAPPLVLPTYGGGSLSSDDLAGRGLLLYVWFTGCPPCVKTTPLLVDLYTEFAAQGLEIVAVNADGVLELPYAEEERMAYARRLGVEFPMTHLTPEVQAALGEVSVFPTFFFIDRAGTIVEHRLNFQTREDLEAAIRKTLE